MKILFAIATVLMLPALLFGANCGGVTPCECGDTVTSSYTVTSNLTCTGSGNILTIGANNVVLDLGGYTLNGSGTRGIGIYAEDKTGIVIRNGTITNGTDSGIYFYGACAGTVTDITATYFSNQAFQTIGTSNITFNNIEGSNNTDDGFSMHDSAVCVINGGVFRNNTNGINIVHNANLTAYDIEISNTGSSGGLALYTSNNSGNLSMHVERFTIDANNGSNGDVVDVDSNLTLKFGTIYNPGSARFSIRQRTNTGEYVGLSIYDPDKNGKGLYVPSGATASISRSIISNLSVGVHYVSGGTLTMSYCDLYGNTTLWYDQTATNSNGITSDPLFSGSDLRLQSTSPCVNAGGKSGALSGFIGDAFGDMRFFATYDRMNIGADQSYSDSSYRPTGVGTVFSR